MESKAIKRNKTTTMRSDSKIKMVRNKKQNDVHEEFRWKYVSRQKSRIGIDHIKYLVSNPWPKSMIRICWSGPWQQLEKMFKYAT